MTPRVTVIVPNYNGAHHLETCLKALAAQTYHDFELLVVDNGSTDNSEAITRALSPSAKWVALGSNRGFAAAANAGIETASATDYIALLNNDTEPSPEWLANLVAGMAGEPRAGLGASKLLTFDDTGVIDAAGDGYSLLRATAVSIGRGASSSVFDTRCWVFGACAAGAIYRRALLDDIGTFDEDFFFWLEDVDLSMRAQAAGYSCLFIPGAVIAHRRGGSSNTQTAGSEAVRLRNHIWVAAKNLPFPLLVVWSIAFAVKVAGRSFSPIRRTKDRNAETNGAAFRAYVRAVSSALLHARRKRREARSARRLGTLAMIRRLRVRPARLV